MVLMLMILLKIIINYTIKIPRILTFINKSVTSDYRGIQHKVLSGGQLFSKSPITGIGQGKALIRAGAPKCSGDSAMLSASRGFVSFHSCKS